MCGIFGVMGNENACQWVLDGLKRLEYRGYDSWGLAWQSHDTIKALKRVGKISQSGSVSFKGRVAMGHTRWATHGKVTQRNAHPHFSHHKTVSVIQNGIVENFAVLRKKLQEKGVVFRSQTDTEVIPNLIEMYLKNHSPIQAIQKAVKKMEGNLAFCVLVKGEPFLYCFKRQAPLVVGKTLQGAFLVSSDAGSFPSEVTENFFLNNHELAVLNTVARLFDAQTGKEKKIVWKKALLSDANDKQGFEHFMLKEIFEQPQVVERLAEKALLIPWGELRAIDSITIVACGTSWHAGMVATYWFEHWLGIPTHCEYASEFRYRKPLANPFSLVIAISQSGETADTLAAIENVRVEGAKVLSICNHTNSSIARASDWVIGLEAGPEIGVASTKAFTAQLTVLAQLASEWAKQKKRKFLVKVSQELREIPLKMQLILKQRRRIKEIAAKMAKFSNAIFLGRNKQFPIALEGALKLKEVSYIHAEGMPAAEMKHGPIALIDANMPVVAIAVHDSLYPKVYSNLQEIKARKGRLIVVTDAASEDLKKIVDELILIPPAHEEVMPLLTVIPLQLLAYEAAVIRKLDVDKPRNLAKSVTVE